MLHLRPATTDDYKDIALLHATNWQHTYRGILSDQYLDNEVIEERIKFWKEQLEQPADNQITTVAIMNDTMVGFSCLILNDDEHYGSLLDNLHVPIHSQKTGIGKLLMQDCAKTVLAKASNNKMYLWVFEANKNARAVYEKLGAIHIETIEHDNWDGTKSMVCRYAWEDAGLLLAGV
ncbi:MAG: GNAT family N-acetyltransferase [Sphingobacteriales bacterium]|nr:GNAT family N-acetyltransferase [Sphingobacteriales bacterium]MBI3719501.1 GNAT family N-acetyltransferase [Sphingobacteriales bacterium]